MLVAVAVNIILRVLGNQRVVPRRMVKHFVKQHTHSKLVRRVDERVQVRRRAVAGINPVVVMHIIGAVYGWVAVDRFADGSHRHHPDIGDAHAFQARKLRRDACEVALRRENFRVQRVNHRLGRPLGRGACCGHVGFNCCGRRRRRRQDRVRGMGLAAAGSRAKQGCAGSRCQQRRSSDFVCSFIHNLCITFGMLRSR